MVTVGEVYSTKSSGDLIVVDYQSAKSVSVRFLFTGTELTTTSRYIRSGIVKDRMYPSVFGVGFMGFGDKKSYAGNGKLTKSYVRWHNMLERCYSSRYQALKPTYIGCKVAKEWHNYQTFCTWFDDNYIEGYELDKDKLGDGKLYSPSTCCFISRSENIEISQARRYVLRHKDGRDVEFFNLSKFCRDNNLTSANIHKVLNGSRSHHKGWSKGE